MKRKERLRFRGVAATTGPVTRNGRTYKFSEEALKKATPTFVGKPVLFGHRGKPIGRIKKSWFEDGKVYVEGVIYEPENEEEKKMIEKVEKGKIKGLSPSITFKLPPKRVALHGSLEVVGEKENGTLIIKGKIPREEIIRKLGSLENVSKYTFTRTWIHDGSLQSKKRIDREMLEENEPPSD